MYGGEHPCSVFRHYKGQVNNVGLIKKIFGKVLGETFGRVIKYVN